MKWIIGLTTGLALLFGIALYGLSYLPYVLYERALISGMNNDFLEIKGAPNEAWLAPVAVHHEPLEGQHFEKWEMFHFSHFELPLPVHHQEFMLIPLIEEYESHTSLGAIFHGLNNREYVRFRVGRSSPFSIHHGRGNLFEMPVFKKALASKTDREVWRDMFELDLRLPGHQTSWWSRLSKLKEIAYEDLVYRLRLLDMRRIYFPEQIGHFFYDPHYDVGRVAVEEPGVLDTQVIKEGIDPEVDNEVIYLLNNHEVHRLRLRTHLYEKTALIYRDFLLTKLRYHASTEESSFPLYAQYRSLSYQERIDQLGMIYLFAAWTHIPERSEFLREMIHFLERGKSHARHLTPLYQYAYRKYGTNYSSFADRLEETADRRARREFYESQEREMNELINRELSSESKDPVNPEERMKFFLRKAIDEEMNEDAKEKILLDYSL